MNAQELWKTAYHQLELQLDRASFETWLRGASLLAVDGDVFVIGVRNEYAKEMLQHRLYRNVRRVLSDVAGRPVELRFELNKAPVQQVAAKEDALVQMPLFQFMARQEPVEAPVPLHQQILRPERAPLPESDLNSKYTFDRFIPGNENQMVFAAAQ
ncbi:MAG: hypothetical protein KC519_19925, partial [Anaerolineae bacterium]|nr:hypothetical protein [Anaerolineae bacterium]